MFIKVAFKNEVDLKRPKNRIIKEIKILPNEDKFNTYGLEETDISYNFIELEEALLHPDRQDRVSRIKKESFDQIHATLFKLQNENNTIIPDPTLSFLFRKTLASRHYVKNAIEIWLKDYNIRKKINNNVKYDVRTCGHFFIALLRANLTKMALMYVKKSSLYGLIVSKSVIFEIQKQFSVENEVDFAEETFKIAEKRDMVTIRMVHCMLRLYFENGYPKRAHEFWKRIQIYDLNFNDCFISRVEDAINGITPWKED